MAAPLSVRAVQNLGLACSHRRACLPLLQRFYNSTPSPNKVQDLHDRGILQNIFPEDSVIDLSWKFTTPQTMYCGFDPTSDSLHIGNLLTIIALIHGQRAGHTALAVIGEATALIGDPSGKTSDRAPITADEVKYNVIRIMENVGRVVDNYAANIHKDLCMCNSQLPAFRIKMLNNMDWYKDKNVIEFLSTVGRKFRLGELLSRHSVQSRINSPQGMSFTEFTYQLFQAYDWLHLYETHKCGIQIGGNDQLGNIASGYELIKKHSVKAPVFGMTVPLVTSTTGEKLGKTAGNAIWLDPTKTSSFELYQYFINIADADVEKYLKLFTFIPLPEIKSIVKSHNAQPEKRIAQNTLAEQVTMLVHGAAGVDAAQQCSRALFEGSTEAMAHLEAKELTQLFKQVPVKKLLMAPNMTIQDLCVKAGCFERPADAERIIRAGGVHLNHKKVTEPDIPLNPSEHILPNNITLIRVGKKTHYLVNWGNCQQMR